MVIIQEIELVVEAVEIILLVSPAEICTGTDKVRRNLGIIIYDPQNIVILLCLVILFIIGHAVYYMKSVRGGKPLLLNYSESEYVSSALVCADHEITVIIDTGAEKSLLDKEVLGFIPQRLNKRISIKLTDFFGNETTAKMVKVKKIRFGNCEFKNFFFIISDNFHRALGADQVQGIIGIDILKYFDLHFFADKYVLSLEKPGFLGKDLKEWKSTALIKRGNYWGMYIDIDNKQFFAIIDTGLPSYLVIPASLQKDISWNEPADEELSFFNLWDDENYDGMSRIILKELKIFDKEILNLPVVMDTGTDQIMVGLDLLSRFDLVISFRRKKIYYKE